MPEIKAFDFDSFIIKFITPALLSAGNPREADVNGLRGSSLRGMWRFWARVIWKGLKEDLSVKDMKKLEAGLFGNTESRAFRMKIGPCEEDYLSKAYPMPHKPGRHGHYSLGAIREGATFKVTIYWPPAWPDLYKRALASIIVLWSTLGSIGQRSRRGFGSVRLFKEKSNGFFNFARLFGTDNFYPPEKFKDIEGLKEFIETVVDKTVDIQLKYFEAIGISGASNRINRPLNDKTFTDMFCLMSREQILIGEKLGKSLYDTDAIKNNEKDENGVIYRVHGTNADREEHGSGKPRLASPLYIRLHKIDGQYIPVATMSYRKSPRNFTNEFKRYCTEILGLKALSVREQPPGAAPGLPETSRPITVSAPEETQADMAREWEVPREMHIEKPKRAKRSEKKVWERFDNAEQLQRLIKDICETEGVIDVIPDWNTYATSGQNTSAPCFERANRMVFLCAAADGQVRLTIKLTCKTKEQWYYVRREIGGKIGIF